MKNWMLILLFCPWYVFSQGYIESIVVDGARTDAKAGGDGVYNISYAHGAGSYHFQIFHSDCTSSLAMSYTYISLPQSVAINGNNYNIDTVRALDDRYARKKCCKGMGREHCS